MQTAQIVLDDSISISKLSNCLLSHKFDKFVIKEDDNGRNILISEEDDYWDMVHILNDNGYDTLTVMY